MRMRPGTLCHTICVTWGAVRMMFLFSATLMIFGFVVEMILIGMIVAPYVRDAEFVQVTCSFSSSRYTGYTDCQDVNRKPNNNFPCLEVKVNFVANLTAVGVKSSSLPVAGGVATIYSVLSYYEDSSSTSQCSSRICYRDSTMNAQQVANLNVTLYNANASYPCFVRQEWSTGKYVALMRREIAEPKVFHALLWPTLCFGIGGFLLWSSYCCFGCKVWPKTVAM